MTDSCCSPANSNSLAYAILPRICNEHSVRCNWDYVACQLGRVVMLVPESHGFKGNVDFPELPSVLFHIGIQNEMGLGGELKSFKARNPLISLVLSYTGISINFTAFDWGSGWFQSRV